MQILGYIALGLSLLSMTMKTMIWLRVLHATSCLVYLIYGYSIAAWPIAVGGLLLFCIHAYHLIYLLKPGK